MAAAVPPPRSPFRWLLVLLLVLVQFVAVPSAYAVTGTASGGQRGVVPEFRCTTDAVWDWSGGQTAGINYKVTCKGTYANAPVFASGASVVFFGTGCTFVSTVPAAAVTFERTGTFKLSSRSSWTGTASGPVGTSCTVTGWRVRFDNAVDVFGVSLPGSENGADGAIALGAPVRTATSTGAINPRWTFEPVVPKVGDGLRSDVLEVSYTPNGSTDTVPTFLAGTYNCSGTPAQNVQQGINRTAVDGAGKRTYWMGGSGSTAATPITDTYQLCGTAGRPGTLNWLYVEGSINGGTNVRLLTVGTVPTGTALPSGGGGAPAASTTPAEPVEPEDPNPANEPNPPSGGCDFGITDPTSWLCGLGGILERIYNAVVELAGAIAGLVGDLLSGLAGLFVPSAATMTRLQNASGVPADAVPFSWFGDAASFVTGALDAQTQCFTLAPTVGPFGQITMLDTCTPAPIEGLIMGKRSLLSVALYISVLAPLLWWAWKTYAPATTANG